MKMPMKIRLMIAKMDALTSFVPTNRGKRRLIKKTMPAAAAAIRKLRLAP